MAKASKKKQKFRGADRDHRWRETWVSDRTARQMMEWEQPRPCKQPSEKTPSPLSFQWRKECKAKKGEGNRKIGFQGKARKVARQTPPKG
jgi:hypothetical protein